MNTINAVTLEIIVIYIFWFITTFSSCLFIRHENVWISYLPDAEQYFMCFMIIYKGFFRESSSALWLNDRKMELSASIGRATPQQLSPYSDTSSASIKTELVFLAATCGCRWAHPSPTSCRAVPRRHECSILSWRLAAWAAVGLLLGCLVLAFLSALLLV